MNLYSLLENLKRILLGMETKSRKFYRIAKENLGRDISPTQNDLGCVESLETIHKLAFGDYIGGKTALLSTIKLKEALMERKDFVRVLNYELGAIVLCVTGEDAIWSGKRGHTGICGQYQIMSNNSATSLWDTKYTKKSWEEYYKGFPIYYFKKVD